jgi:hypothetical protein
MTLLGHSDTLAMRYGGRHAPAAVSKTSSWIKSCADEMYPS